MRRICTPPTCLSWRSGWGAGAQSPQCAAGWNEKLGALRFSRWMAPTLVAGRVSALLLFADEQQEIVLKPLGGRAGLGVIRVNGQSPG